jgi:hypothetical protein
LGYVGTSGLGCPAERSSTVLSPNAAGFLTPLRGLFVLFVVSHGLRRGLYSFAALRLPLVQGHSLRGAWAKDDLLTLDDELDPISGRQF